MKLAFYKSNCGTWVDKIVGWFSKKAKRSPHGAYSHVELIFSDGIAFTSNPKEGTVLKPFDFEDDCWDFLELPIEKEEEIRSWCLNLVGKKYNWSAIIIYVGGYLIFGRDYSTLKTRENQNFWLCTELISFILYKFGIITVDEIKICPSETYEVIKDYLEENC